MADDLIIRYFREDLSEAEDQALSDLLASSEEEAFRFFQHAEAAYSHYGLPEPKWPSQGGGPMGPGPSRSWSWLVGLGLLAAGAVWWGLRGTGPLGSNFFSSGKALGDGRQVSMAVVPPVQDGTVKTSQRPMAAGPSEEEMAGNGSNEGIFSRSSQRVSPAAGESSSGVPGPQPASHPSHPNLEVLVRQKKSGPVTVQVLSPNGDPVVLLYQGPLQPGDWTFEWNGDLPQGRKTPPGTYHIKVCSGGTTMTRSVLVKER